MKVLLDESLDRSLRTRIGQQDVLTVAQGGCQGLKNGKLIEAAEAAGFDVLLTGDQSLPYEQNSGGRQLAIVAMSSVEWQIVKHHLPKIIAAIDNAVPGSFQTVDCGKFTRWKTF